MLCAPNDRAERAEEVKLSAEEEEEEAGVQRVTQAAESAVWRLTEGQGDPADRITASRSAKGRLDFVLQVQCLYRLLVPLAYMQTAINH